MKFENRWIQWIMECVTSVSFTLIVNGNLTSYFKPSQDLRQGDPLSPYFFLFCANILSIALLQAESHKQLQGVKFGRNGLSFTHLLFADDSLLFLQKGREVSDQFDCYFGLVLLSFWSENQFSQI